MRTPLRKPHTLPDYPTSFDYIIRENNARIELLDGDTGKLLYSNNDFYTVLMYAHDDAPAAYGASCMIRTPRTAAYYSLSATVNITKPFNLYGNGCNWLKGTVIRLANNVDDDMFNYDGGGTNIYFPSVMDIMFNGNNDNNTGGSILHYVDDCSDGWITRCGLTKPGKYGVQCATARMNITDTWIEYSGWNGISATGGEMRIVNSHITYSGIYNISAASSIQISNSCLSLAAKSAVSYGGSDNICIIRGCRINGNGTNGGSDDSAVELDTGTLIASSNEIDGAEHEYAFELKGNSHDSEICGNYIGAVGTGPFLDAGTRNKYNHCGTETANAETPQDALWRIGDTVAFIDSGDASGDGLYIKNYAGNWVQIG